MLTQFIYQWNPFNIYGIKSEVEDLISDPLRPNETLMQDGYGYCRRIKVPPLQSTFWERMIFWLQTHLNEKGHLETIDKLISLFYQKVLQSPPGETEKLQELSMQIDRLRFLKNDYSFNCFTEENSAFIDSRLKEIEEHAYSIFTYYYKQQASEQEKERKRAFILFQEKIRQRFQNLALEHAYGLIKARFLMILPSTILKYIAEKHVHNLDSRLEEIQHLHQQINDIEKKHEGKFTIPYLNDQLNRMRNKLDYEVCKIAVEVEILIKSLILNYHLLPFKEEVKMLLDLIEIDPEELTDGNLCAYLFQEALEVEIKRMKKIFNSSPYAGNKK